MAGPNLWAKRNDNGYPCGRWTCPKDGRYDIRGRFTGNDSRGVDNFVYVVINGSIVFSGRVQAYLQVVSFTNDNISLNQGDVVDFTLTWGGGVYSEYGWTDVDAVISEAGPAVPKLDIRCSQVELCWSTTPNTWYQLQYRSVLTTNEWIPLTGSWVPGTGDRHCTNDSIPLGQPQRFYQLAITNAPPSP